MDLTVLNNLRNQLSVEAKNGIDFTISATIIWMLISFIWQLDISAYNKSVFVFMAGGPLLPMAFMFSKILKTKWKMPDNPIQPLGLWLNFAQLFYFPFLIFILVKMPDYFIMTYAIITGAHFFPYAWFYDVKWYGIFGGIIALGSLLSGLFLKQNNFFLIGAGTSVALGILSVLLYFDFKSKMNRTQFVTL
jgi:hypothetical protein